MSYPYDCGVIIKGTNQDQENKETQGKAWEDSGCKASLLSLCEARMFHCSGTWVFSPTRKLHWASVFIDFTGNSLHWHYWLNQWPHVWPQPWAAPFPLFPQWKDPVQSPNLLITWFVFPTWPAPILSHLLSINLGRVWGAYEKQWHSHF